MAEGDPEPGRRPVEQVSDAERPGALVAGRSGAARRPGSASSSSRVYVLVAVFAPLIAPHDPTDGSLRRRCAGPSGEHWLGTNTSRPGHRLPARSTAPGSRCSSACSAGSLATAIALVIGMVSGYAEGTIVDDILSFVTNVALVIPVLPLIITLVAYSEVRGVGLIVGVIAITSWAGAARAKRSQIITLRNRDFVTAAKFSGEGPVRIIFREIMPNMTSLVAAGFVGAATGAIGAEAGLAVLGLGDTQTRSPGARCSTRPTPRAPSRRACGSGCFAPGLVLAILITAMTFINFGVDLLTNPHLRED